MAGTGRQPIKIIGLCGSPRHANTDILLKTALESAEELPGVETEFYSVADMVIKGGCTACYDCILNPSRERLCTAFNDDVNAFYEKWMEADGIIVGVPVYYNGPTAQLKCVMDRTLALEVLGFPIRNQVGGVLTIGYDRHGGQEFTIDEVLRWLLMLDIIVIGIGPERPAIGSGSYLGAAATQGFPRPIFVPEPDEPKAVLGDPVGLLAAKHLGKRVAEVAKVVRYGFNNLAREETHWPDAAVMEGVGFLPPDVQARIGQKS